MFNATASACGEKSGGRKPMANPTNRKARAPNVPDEVPLNIIETLPLWQLDVAELTGHNLESRGREEVNRLLATGWRLLHIYTLKYQEDGIWRERPMAILGRLRSPDSADISRAPEPRP
jgi:hypothetical protein